MESNLYLNLLTLFICLAQTQASIRITTLNPKNTLNYKEKVPTIKGVLDISDDPHLMVSQPTAQAQLRNYQIHSTDWYTHWYRKWCLSPTVDVFASALLSQKFLDTCRALSKFSFACQRLVGSEFFIIIKSGSMCAISYCLILGFTAEK